MASLSSSETRPHDPTLDDAIKAMVDACNDFQAEFEFAKSLLQLMDCYKSVHDSASDRNNDLIARSNGHTKVIRDITSALNASNAALLQFPLE